MALRSAYTQWFPPAPSLTEKNLPSQAGKVFIVTGGNQGIGYELIKTLYSKDATVYMATRSKERAEAAIETIKASYTDESKPTGDVKFLLLDLNDLTTIKASAAAFAAQESKLHVLWNNAGVASVPVGTVTAQNIEQHLGVNCMAPLLFTKLLLPQLREATKASPAGSVRIIWSASWLAESQAPKGGIDFNLLPNGCNDANKNYALSKCGNWLLAVAGAKRYGAEGIMSLAQNPGNLSTNLWQHVPKAAMVFFNPLLHKVVLGAYTELYAGLSEDIKSPDHNGAYIIPWGRIQKSSPRKDIIKAMKTVEEGGEDVASKFWAWCEENTQQYA